MEQQSVIPVGIYPLHFSLRVTQLTHDLKIYERYINIIRSPIIADSVIGYIYRVVGPTYLQFNRPVGRLNYE